MTMSGIHENEILLLLLLLSAMGDVGEHLHRRMKRNLMRLCTNSMTIVKCVLHIRVHLVTG